MHDPKLSASVKHHQIRLTESLVDKFSSSQQLHHLSNLSSDHVDPINQRYSKPLALQRTAFSSASYPEDVLDSRSQGRLLPLFHRLKDSGTTSEMLHYSGYESAFSEVASKYRYSDLLQARRLYESLHGDQTSLTLPLSLSTVSRRLAENIDYVFLDQSSGLRSSIVIKDVSSAPSALTRSSLSSKPSSQNRLADSLSLSPLHVSTTVPSSPLSSESSPSPHRRSSVSPDSRWTDTHTHQMTRPSLISSLSVPGDVPLYHEYTLRGDPIFPSPALPPSFSFPQPLWHPSPSMYGPEPPPLICVYAPQATPFESRANISQLFNNCISSSQSLAHHHLHHHLHRHHFVRDSLYNGDTPGSSLDPRSSPGKELPTKLLKQDRIRDRQELSGALDADKEHTERLCNVKKSASTQTQFSSFNCENLPPPPYYTTHDTITRDKLHTSSAPGHTFSGHLPPPPLPPSFLQYSHALSSYHSPLNASSSHIQSVPPPPHTSAQSTSFLLHTPQTPSNRHALAHSSPSPPVLPTLPPLSQNRKCSPSTPQSLPPYSTTPPPPPPQYPSHTRTHIDVQHAPLNLSLSSTPPATSLIPHSRPAATGMSTSSSSGETDSYRGRVTSEESINHRIVSDTNGSNHEIVAQVSDEAIEEHFRRSLGKCYNEPSPPKKVAVHVSEKICSVDDHFARALGDQMWTEIKAKSEPAPLDSHPGSVDAHFAKALGAAMWKKLKAENKLVDDVSTTNQQHSQPQQTEDAPHRQKSAPSSPLQKPLVT